MNKEELIRELYSKYHKMHMSNISSYMHSDNDYLREIDNEVMSAVYDVVKKYVECNCAVCESN